MDSVANPSGIPSVDAVGEGLSLDQKNKVCKILDQVTELTNLERLFLYLQLPTADPQKQNENPVLKKSSVALKWLQSHYIEDHNSSIQKQDVFEKYRLYCKDEKLDGINTAADFGKIVKLAFPNIHHRRLGQRGKSKYCYIGLKERNASVKQSTGLLVESPEIRGRLEDSDLHKVSCQLICEWAGLILEQSFPNISVLSRHLLKTGLSCGKAAAKYSLVAGNSSPTFSQEKKRPLSVSCHQDRQQLLQRKLRQNKLIHQHKKRVHQCQSQQKAAYQLSHMVSPMVSPVHQYSLVSTEPVTITRSVSVQPLDSNKVVHLNMASPRLVGEKDRVAGISEEPEGQLCQFDQWVVNSQDKTTFQLPARRCRSSGVCNSSFATVLPTPTSVGSVQEYSAFSQLQRLSSVVGSSDSMRSDSQTQRSHTDSAPMSTSSVSPVTPACSTPQTVEVSSLCHHKRNGTSISPDLDVSRTKRRCITSLGMSKQSNNQGLGESSASSDSNHTQSRPYSCPTVCIEAGERGSQSRPVSTDNCTACQMEATKSSPVSEDKKGRSKDEIHSSVKHKLAQRSVSMKESDLSSASSNESVKFHCVQKPVVISRSKPLQPLGASCPDLQAPNTEATKSSYAILNSLLSSTSDVTSPSPAPLSSQSSSISFSLSDISGTKWKLGSDNSSSLSSLPSRSAFVPVTSHKSLGGSQIGDKSLSGDSITQAKSDLQALSSNGSSSLSESSKLVGDKAAATEDSSDTSTGISFTKVFGSTPALSVDSLTSSTSGMSGQSSGQVEVRKCVPQSPLKSRPDQMSPAIISSTLPTPQTQTSSTTTTPVFGQPATTPVLGQPANTPVLGQPARPVSSSGSSSSRSLSRSEMTSPHTPTKRSTKSRFTPIRPKPIATNSGSTTVSPQKKEPSTVSSMLVQKRVRTAQELLLNLASTYQGEVKVQMSAELLGLSSSRSSKSSDVLLTLGPPNKSTTSPAPHPDLGAVMTPAISMSKELQIALEPAAKLTTAPLASPVVSTDVITTSSRRTESGRLSAQSFPSNTPTPSGSSNFIIASGGTQGSTELKLISSCAGGKTTLGDSRTGLPSSVVVEDNQGNKYLLEQQSHIPFVAEQGSLINVADLQAQVVGPDAQGQSYLLVPSVAPAEQTSLLSASQTMTINSQSVPVSHLLAVSSHTGMLSASQVLAISSTSMHQPNAAQSILSTVRPSTNSQIISCPASLSMSVVSQSSNHSTSTLLATSESASLLHPNNQSLRFSVPPLNQSVISMHSAVSSSIPSLLSSTPSVSSQSTVTTTTSTVLSTHSETHHTQTTTSTPSRSVTLQAVNAAISSPSQQSTSSVSSSSSNPKSNQISPSPAQSSSSALLSELSQLVNVEHHSAAPLASLDPRYCQSLGALSTHSKDSGDADDEDDSDQHQSASSAFHSCTRSRSRKSSVSRKEGAFQPASSGRPVVTGPLPAAEDRNNLSTEAKTSSENIGYDGGLLQSKIQTVRKRKASQSREDRSGDRKRLNSSSEPARLGPEEASGTSDEILREVQNRAENQAFKDRLVKDSQLLSEDDVSVVSEQSDKTSLTTGQEMSILSDPKVLETKASDTGFLLGLIETSKSMTIKQTVQVLNSLKAKLSLARQGQQKGTVKESLQRLLRPQQSTNIPQQTSSLPHTRSEGPNHSPTVPHQASPSFEKPRSQSVMGVGSSAEAQSPMTTSTSAAKFSRSGRRNISLNVESLESDALLDSEPSLAHKLLSDMSDSGGHKTSIGVAVKSSKHRSSKSKPTVLGDRGSVTNTGSKDSSSKGVSQKQSDVSESTVCSRNTVIVNPVRGQGQHTDMAGNLKSLLDEACEKEIVSLETCELPPSHDLSKHWSGVSGKPTLSHMRNNFPPQSDLSQDKEQSDIDQNSQNKSAKTLSGSNCSSTKLTSLEHELPLDIADFITESMSCQKPSSLDALLKRSSNKTEDERKQRCLLADQLEASSSRYLRSLSVPNTVPDSEMAILDRTKSNVNTSMGMEQATVRSHSVLGLRALTTDKETTSYPAQSQSDKAQSTVRSRSVLGLPMDSVDSSISQSAKDSTVNRQTLTNMAQVIHSGRTESTSHKGGEDAAQSDTFVSPKGPAKLSRRSSVDRTCVDAGFGKVTVDLSMCSVKELSQNWKGLKDKQSAENSVVSQSPTEQSWKSLASAKLTGDEIDNSLPLGQVPVSQVNLTDGIGMSLRGRVQDPVLSAQIKATARTVSERRNRPLICLSSRYPRTDTCTTRTISEGLVSRSLSQTPGVDQGYSSVSGTPVSDGGYGSITPSPVLLSAFGECERREPFSPGVGCLRGTTDSTLAQVDVIADSLDNEPVDSLIWDFPEFDTMSETGQIEETDGKSILECEPTKLLNEVMKDMSATTGDLEHLLSLSLQCIPTPPTSPVIGPSPLVFSDDPSVSCKQGDTGLHSKFITPLSPKASSQAGMRRRNVAVSPGAPQESQHSPTGTPNFSPSPHQPSPSPHPFFSHPSPPFTPSLASPRCPTPCSMVSPRCPTPFAETSLAPNRFMPIQSSGIMPMSAGSRDTYIQPIRPVVTLASVVKHPVDQTPSFYTFFHNPQPSDDFVTFIPSSDIATYSKSQNSISLKQGKPSNQSPLGTRLLDSDVTTSQGKALHPTESQTGQHTFVNQRAQQIGVSQDQTQGGVVNQNQHTVVSGANTITDTDHSKSPTLIWSLPGHMGSVTSPGVRTVWGKQPREQVLDKRSTVTQSPQGSKDRNIDLTSDKFTSPRNIDNEAQSLPTYEEAVMLLTGQKLHPYTTDQATPQFTKQDSEDPLQPGQQKLKSPKVNRSHSHHQHQPTSSERPLYHRQTSESPRPSTIQTVGSLDAKQLDPSSSFPFSKQLAMLSGQTKKQHRKTSPESDSLPAVQRRASSTAPGGMGPSLKDLLQAPPFSMSSSSSTSCVSPALRSHLDPTSHSITSSAGTSFVRPSTLKQGAMMKDVMYTPSSHHSVHKELSSSSSVISSSAIASHNLTSKADSSLHRSVFVPHQGVSTTLPRESADYHTVRVDLSKGTPHSAQPRLPLNVAQSRECHQMPSQTSSLPAANYQGTTPNIDPTKMSAFTGQQRSRLDMSEDDLQATLEVLKTMDSQYFTTVHSDDTLSTEV